MRDFFRMQKIHFEWLTFLALVSMIFIPQEGRAFSLPGLFGKASPGVSKINPLPVIIPTGCHDKSECPQGQVCNASGQCIDPNTVWQYWDYDKGYHCGHNSFDDCPCGQICSRDENDTCVTIIQVNSCNSNDDCPDMNFLNTQWGICNAAHVCVPESGSCAADNQCACGRYCKAGSCVPRCSSNDDCSLYNEFCNPGTHKCEPGLSTPINEGFVTDITNAFAIAAMAPAKPEATPVEFHQAIFTILTQQALKKYPCLKNNEAATLVEDANSVITNQYRQNAPLDHIISSFNYKMRTRLQDPNSSFNCVNSQ
jgi:hypothetical protein